MNSNHKQKTETSIKPKEDVDFTPENEPVILPIPPDGGYGYIIIISSFFVNFIVDGVCFSVGVFQEEFKDYFQISSSKAAVVSSVLNGMYLSMGPIVSILANKFGCRLVSIIGSIISAFAFVITSFSTNINMVILTFAALGGFGFGLIYLPSIVMVGYYFEKKRALATGIAVCGSGIGGFVFAPLCDYLIYNYSWRGAVYIIAGLVFNGAICGSLFRPIEITNNKRRSSIRILTNDEGLLPQSSDNERISKVINLKDSEKPANDINISKKLCSSHQVLTNFEDHSNRVFCKSMDDIKFIQRHEILVTTETFERNLHYKNDRFYGGSLTAVDVNSFHNIDLKGMEIDKIQAKKKGPLTAIIGFYLSLKHVMDFSLLWNPVFAIYGLSCFLCMAGFFIPFAFIVGEAINKGYTRSDGSLLISVICISNTISRVLCGWISDKPWADCLIINNFALIIGGITTMFIPFCYTYTSLSISSFIFGMCIAIFVSLRSIIMVELIGLEKLTNAFGLVTMCQGISAFLGPPIAGILSDDTNRNYKAGFIFAGSCLCLAGIICLPLRRISNKLKLSKPLSISINKTMMK